MDELFALPNSIPLSLGIGGQRCTNVLCRSRIGVRRLRAFEKRLLDDFAHRMHEDSIEINFPARAAANRRYEKVFTEI